MSENALVQALEEAFQEVRHADMPLGEKLDFIAATVRRLSPEFATAVDSLVNRLKHSEAGASAPAPGDPFPTFLLPDQRGRLVDLESLLEKGPVAVSFHRGHWCPYCRLNAQALADAQAEAASLGGQIVAISPDRQKFTNALAEEADAPFPILTDIDNGYALSLNLAIWVGQEMQTMIGGAGWDLPCYQGNGGWMLPIPATFVIGTDGLVKARYVDPDYRKRMAIDSMLTALRQAR